jgi:hypothetical protein
MCMYRPVTVCSHYFSRDVYQCDLQVFELGWRSVARSGQAKLKKPSQAIDGKLLSVLSHMVGEKTQSALRKEQGWTHLLWCCQRLATQVCMRQSVK